MNWRLLLPAIVSICLLTACVPGASGPSQQTGSSAPSAPQHLRMGITVNDEPDAEEGGVAFNSSEAGYILHSSLTVYDTSTGKLTPRLSERVPTVENGDWRVSPEGRMELTWKLRPDVLWHDGTRLTADDFVFGFKVTMDSELFARGTGILSSISEIVAPDPQTVVMRWKEINIAANEMGRNRVIPLPRHLIGNLYETATKAAVASNPYWMTEFVGVGPYRMTQWLEGSFIEVAAFDQYFLGRPRIDRITIRYFGDVNTLTVTTIANDIDVAPGGSFKEDEAFALKTQWESRGDGTVMVNLIRTRNGGLQFRDPAAPWVVDVRVRQALVHMLDRQGLVDTLKHGLSQVETIQLSRNSNAYRLAQQQGLPTYPYDVDRAHRLMAEAGLARGPDGTYRTRGGDPFVIQAGATGDIQSNIQEILAIADQWKRAGLDASAFIVPDPHPDQREIRSKINGIDIAPSSLDPGGYRRYATSEISGPANRWRSSNRGGYSHPAYDELVSRLFATLRESEREPITIDLARHLLEHLPLVPLYYTTEVVAVKKGVHGITNVVPGQDVSSWNVHEWKIG